MLRQLVLVLAAWLMSGCVGSPSPLAPQLKGSVGVPHHGTQSGAVELPVEGEGYVRYRRHSPVYWGNPRLVTAIEEAALAVHEKLPGGAPMLVGDLSARHGGKIPRHRSHRTGRDVDFLWYVTTPGGAPIRNPGFVHIEADGLARVGDGNYVQLDVERQWAFFKELMTSPHIDVQFMFVSRDVEALLTDYARARGEPLELIWRAETVMLQPPDSAPHADHAHLRIACAPEEFVFGCEGGGPYWEWLPQWPQLEISKAQLEVLTRDDPPPPLLPPDAGAGAKQGS